MLHRKYASHLVGVLCLWLLASCATTPQTLELTQRPPQGLSPAAELQEVPFFPQLDYQCGPASLATILNYNGIDVTPEQLASRVYLPGRQGSLQIEMIATARNAGLMSYKLAPQLANILAEIDHGNPVLVFQNLALDLWPKWHYAVAVGYDLQRSELILRSGAYARHRISFSTFERTWQRAGLWAYVFSRPGSVPATATVTDYIHASHELQQTGGLESALSAYREGVRRWPNDSLMLLTHANAEYQSGHFENAIDSLQREIRLRADNTVAWNNLAYALVASDCRNQAIAALRCAQRIAPGDANIADSLVDIAQGSAGNTGSCKTIACPVAPP